ncbi:MAG: hypothetical protein L6Q38_09585, partial [Nitrospira sp.]|nr:hypothetical protein [Nitrospira sp.]
MMKLSLAVGLRWCFLTGSLFVGCTGPPPSPGLSEQEPKASPVQALREQGHRWLAKGDLGRAGEFFLSAR